MPAKMAQTSSVPDDSTRRPGLKIPVLALCSSGTPDAITTTKTVDATSVTSGTGQQDQDVFLAHAARVSYFPPFTTGLLIDTIRSDRYSVTMMQLDRIVGMQKELKIHYDGQLNETGLN